MCGRPLACGVFVATLLALVLAGAALAQDIAFPALTGRVVDEAGLLTPSQRVAIEQKLADLEAKTTDQFVVVTVRSLGGRTIEEYGYRLGRQWAIGQKDKNNGILLIVAPNERKVRIEVGYGLEGTLPDAISSVIVQNSILPRFRANDYPGGIARGVDDVIKVLSGDAEEFKRQAQPQRTDAHKVVGLFGVLAPFLFSAPGLILLIILLHLLFLFIRKIAIWLGFVPKQPRHGSFWDTAGSGWSSGSGSSWSSGDSGGGFSGGGGSFGGGGSSGSW